MTTEKTALSLSLLTSLGGIIGYARTGSVPSIAAGVSIGALYLYSYTRLQANQPYGDELALLASAVLGGSSIPRAIKTRKVVPIGLGGLAVVGGVVFGSAVYNRR
ncbi:TMEM14 family protein [Aspergillus candidus]|uniref:Transmembrane proteins 14C-domain-containing protein n=1 Tax=Aspergillus candidus TaxID=41067 RepID=A0A2I2FMU0_ASPCN|nr:transmembrane proteins 14C-domain-containing protein [Aspergillus candidus]PLB41945.1 transmembrane proteins 14C-domain-containing protein [Aspergillus candidus]